MTGLKECQPATQRLGAPALIAMNQAGEQQWFAATSQGRLNLKPSYLKISTGSHSQHFHHRSALPLLSVSPPSPGPYVIRVKVPSGVKLMPHRHPEDRIYTVMSGVFYIGLGDRFDGDQVQAYPPGSVIVLPGRHIPLPLGKVR